MVEEDYGIERRTLASKYLLRNAEKITFKDWQKLEDAYLGAKE